MNRIKVDSDGLKQIMKIIGPCTGKKTGLYVNVQIAHKDNRLTIRGMNGTFVGEMSMKVPGGEGDTFCIDADMFTKVINLNNGDVEILTDGKNCVLKGIGRMRIPIVAANVNEPDRLNGETVTMKAEHFKSVYKLVSYAKATDESRPLLTGVLIESDGDRLRMVAIDGFQIAIENAPCSGDCMEVIVPGSFMDLVASAVTPGEEIDLITNGRLIQVKTDSMTLQCPLLVGNYLDYKKLIPESFQTECMIFTDRLMDALKSSSIVNNKLGTVKLSVRDNSITVSNNSQYADFEDKIPCDMTGNDIRIAFNEHYLMNTIGAVNTDKAVMKFNRSVSPVFVQAKGSDGIHILTPVKINEVLQDG